MSLYEAKDWQSPVTMARDLLRRHRDLSTVRAMVRNEFGRGPDIDDLRKMQERQDEAEVYLSRRFASIDFEANAVAAVEQHEAEMTRGSKGLLDRIASARPL